MTRINLVPPSELCDQHLLAEHRELTRIPNAVARGWFPQRMPADYTLGTGHVSFFADKLLFLWKRYYALGEECKARGFSVTSRWPKDFVFADCVFQDYYPCERAIELNRSRINERLSQMKRKPKWTKGN